MKKERKDLYKVWFEAKSDQEAVEIERDLVKQGFNMFDIYVFRYQGADGNFHREVFVFND